MLRRLSLQTPTAGRNSVPEALDVSTAEAILRGLVETVDQRDAVSVWSAFCAFAVRKAAGLRPEADEDLLLCDFSAGDAGAEGNPSMSLVRQFSDSDDDDAAIEQLICELHFEPDSSLADTFASQPARWGQAGPAARTWIAAVEASPAFQAAHAANVRRVRVHQTLV